MPPEISVVIPAYNHERFLRETIDSVLGQSYENLELIIVDDGSTDKSAEVIRRYSDPRLCYIYQENQDAYNALNRGLSLAKGSYIAILNSDDVYAQNRLQRLLEVQRQSGAQCLFTRVNLIDDKSIPLADPALWWNRWYDDAVQRYLTSGDLYTAFLQRNLMITTSNLFLTKEAVAKVGGFSPLRYLHDYDYISSDLLKSYVCAGPDDEVDPAAAGRYAMLTKVANVYMRLPEFQVPTIITDTPGVNDPFLVRDEFTCRSLDKSDVFVIVLSAHQPLTEVDIALIRILAKQDNKDVLVFVNRIDELDDYDADVPRVIDDVTQRLCGAIPDIDFTIVAGSAWMADLTLQDGPEAEAQRAALDDTRLARYIHSRYGYLPDDRCERLMLASGMRDVKMALSQVIDSGVGRHQMAQIKADIRAELNGALFVARRERASLQTQAGAVNSEVANMAIEDLQAEIDAIRLARQRLHQLQRPFDGSDRHLRSTLRYLWKLFPFRN